MMDMNEKIEGYLRKIRGEEGEKFEIFRRLLLECNQKYNLTSITEEKDVLYKHFLDSAAGEFLFPLGARVLEVGSGAGFPSIVLKILRPDLCMTLTDSVGKKCAFLQEACRALDFSDVEVIHARVEELAVQREYREKYDVACARAVAPMNTLAEYCLPFVRVGGKFIAYKGGDEEEIRAGKRAVSLLGGKTEKVYVFDLPEGYGRRTLVDVKKIFPTPSKYPRGNGKERKNPIV